ncbi:hypothetical protein [Roseofilum casamattae]|uniref:Uncharacterized protein n=1 Tax=Roseofilum casamattae BLCC-M143 TaxID=3022442 RepID=A0ABT7BZ98_9CYAN|nr:hypothetical protein [Roseofilum casamattae]MDJ1184533.1 hypothetical protein [Roseofilum casamattae BLCC-M143]
MNNPGKMSSHPKLELLQEIEHIPEEYIPSLLELVRSFRQRRIKTSSVESWNDAIVRLNSGDFCDRKLKRERIQEMFVSWSELDDEQEQQESLELIQSLEKTSI